MLRKYDLQHSEIQQFSLYNDGNLAILDRITDFARQLDRNPEAAITADFYTLILCLKDEISFLYDDIQMHIVPNTLLLIPPGVVVTRLHHAPHFTCRVICIAPSYASRLIPMGHNAWSLRQLLKQQPLMTLSQQEACTINQYCNLLQLRAGNQGMSHRQIIDSLMQTLLFELRDIATASGLAAPKPFTSAEYLFNKFIEIMESSYPKDRKVETYAKRLNVSAKYFSLVCKQVCHQTCSALTNQYVARDIERQLRFSPKNIKEITHEMGFPNPSFFTRFVKRHLGASPKTLRERWTRELNLTDTETAPDNQSK